MRESQGRQHSQEMGSPGHAVEGSHKQGGVGMAMPRSMVPARSRLPMGMPEGTGVEMRVHMAGMAMRVEVRVQTVPTGQSEPPNANPNQHNPHQSLRQGRHRVEGKESPEHQRQHADQQDAARMAQAPAQPTPPSAPVLHRQGRDSRQMVRSGEDVDAAGQKSGKDREHVMDVD
jgi:hypothetical protein